MFEKYNEVLKPYIAEAVKDIKSEISRGITKNHNAELNKYVVTELFEKLFNFDFDGETSYSNVVGKIIKNEQPSNIVKFTEELTDYISSNIYSLCENIDDITLSETEVKSLFYNTMLTKKVTPIVESIFSKFEYTINECFVDCKNATQNEINGKIYLGEEAEVEDTSFITNIINNIGKDKNFIAGTQTYLMYVIADWLRFNTIDMNDYNQRKQFADKLSLTDLTTEVKKSFNEKIKKILLTYQDNISLSKYLETRTRFYDTYLKNIAETEIRLDVIVKHLKKIMAMQDNKYEYDVETMSYKKKDGTTEHVNLTSVMNKIKLIASTLQKVKGLWKLETSMKKYTLHGAIVVALESIVSFFTDIIHTRISTYSQYERLPKGKQKNIIFSHISRRLLTFDGILSNSYQEFIHLYAHSLDKNNLDFLDYDEVMKWEDTFNKVDGGNNDNLPTKDMLKKARMTIKNGIPSGITTNDKKMQEYYINLTMLPPNTDKSIKEKIREKIKQLSIERDKFNSIEDGETTESLKEKLQYVQYMLKHERKMVEVMKTQYLPSIRKKVDEDPSVQNILAYKMHYSVLKAYEEGVLEYEKIETELEFRINTGSNKPYTANMTSFTDKTNVGGKPSVNMDKTNVGGKPSVNMDKTNVGGKPSVNMDKTNVGGKPIYDPDKTK